MGRRNPRWTTAVGLDGMTAVAGSFAITYNGSSSVPVNAGTYTVVATFTSSNPNYNSGSPADGTVVITAATPTLTVSVAVVYNGLTASPR